MPDTYCKMPFVGFQFTHRSNRLCCSALSSKKMSASDFWNSDYIQEVRRKMKNNIRVPDCQKCYAQEEANVHSQRKTYDTLWKDYPEADLPSAMDLDLSNFCNLKCIMCSADRSSQWAGSVSSVSQEQLDNLCSISSNIKQLTIQGGEPSIMPEFVYYFEHLEKIGIIGDIEIDCISNLTNVNNRFYELLSKFKNVRILASIDAYGSANDYIRHPSHFEKVEQNLIELSTRSNLNISLISSTQVLSMYNFGEFINWFRKINDIYNKNGKDFQVNINRVTHPNPLNISNAPLLLKEKFVKDLELYDGFDLGAQFNSEIKSMQNNLLSEQPALMLTGNIRRNGRNIKLGASQLRQYVEQIDSDRNIKITNYIPNFYKYL